MAGGRPTKYKPEYCEDIIAYFHDHQGFPTIEGFAVYECDVNIDTVYEWAKIHPEFSEAKKKAMSIQKHRLCEGAFSGELNTTFSIFFAKNNCGMKDKVEQEHSGLESLNINIVKPRDKRGEK